MVSKMVPLKKTVRVATNNNFNCTLAEFKQLDELAASRPNYYFFINSNINTPRLLAINEHPYKAVVTINPTLKVVQKSVDKLYQLDKKKVAFVRVKLIPKHPEIQELITKLAKDNYAVVVTVQRWNSKKSAATWSDLDFYKYNHSRYRLTGVELEGLHTFVDASDKKVFICDRLGIGCAGCKLCIMLTSGEQSKLASINLSSSGVCKFNCPDCYAKRMSEMAVSFGNSPIAFDKIKANYKQSGNTAHIQETLKEVRG